jgi:crotonobetainyl-CoA:carnitine CoA-transferase CaiB-like acyl-CoA transferase
MARYPILATAVPDESLHQSLLDVLESCQLEIIHDTADYVMAREKPSGIPYAKLVTVEGLIDKTGATEDKIRVEVVVKNEELPVHSDNHCSRMRDSVHQALENSSHWSIIAS